MQRLKNFITVGGSIALTALLVLHAGLVGAGGNAEVPVSAGVPAVELETPDARESVLADMNHDGLLNAADILLLTAALGL